MSAAEIKISPADELMERIDDFIRLSAFHDTKAMLREARAMISKLQSRSERYQVALQNALDFTVRHSGRMGTVAADEDLFALEERLRCALRKTKIESA